jgi:hypothetical protein
MTRTSTSLGLLRPPEEDALLQHAQELDLEGGAHVAHLVQEERAPVGHLEQALLVADGPREAALDVPNSALSSRLSLKAEHVLHHEGRSLRGPL